MITVLFVLVLNHWARSSQRRLTKWWYNLDSLSTLTLTSSASIFLEVHILIFCFVLNFRLWLFIHSIRMYWVFMELELFWGYNLFNLFPHLQVFVTLLMRLNLTLLENCNSPALSPALFSSKAINYPVIRVHCCVPVPRKIPGLE